MTYNNLLLHQQVHHHKIVQAIYSTPKNQKYLLIFDTDISNIVQAITNTKI